MRKFIIVLTVLLLILTVGCSVTVSAYCVENNESSELLLSSLINDNFVRLSFNDYSNSELVLDAIDKYELILTFRYYMSDDEIEIYKDCVYWYDIYNDALIIHTIDYVMVYNDLNL